MHIVIATSPQDPALDASDQLYGDALQALGATVSAVPWTSIDAGRLQTADAVVLRSTWGYHNHMEAFRDWIDLIDESGVRTFNAPDMLRWNIDKAYLHDLAARGINVPATMAIEAEDQATLSACFERLGAERAVLKPRFGGSGTGVILTAPDSLRNDLETMRRELDDRPFLLQAFIPEIATGELSFVFIGGTFAHAIRKQPVPGEFRSNSRYGTTFSRTEPPAGQVEAAAAILAKVAPQSLYARIDCVARAEGLVCMEVELVEPSLFMTHAPETAKLFARRTVEALVGATPSEA
jgi:glutathione synthase/RimK-type ligase-like ATP-grasp enzyme